MKRAFSLLEIVLALAILAGALAALGEVMRLGDQNAAAAADESQADLLAESVMSELIVGARPLTNVNNAALGVDANPPWEFSIEMGDTQLKELIAVRVTVAQQLPAALQPAGCTLIRWLPNPDYLPAAAEQSAASTGAPSSGGQR